MQETKRITIDLDALNLERDQGMDSGIGVADIDFIKDGKKVRVVLSLFKHSLKSSPILTMTTINKTRDIIKMVQVKPWVDISEQQQQEKKHHDY